MADQAHEDDATETARIESAAQLAAVLDAEQERMIDRLLAREFGL
ncbi:hypothetical protein [Methylobacterium sp.]|nr:hypothetical protein [Methylobacterium sp.]